MEMQNQSHDYIFEISFIKILCSCIIIVQFTQKNKIPILSAPLK